MKILEAIETINNSLFGGLDSGFAGINGFVMYIIPYCSALAATLMIVLVGTKVFSYFMNPSGNMDPYVLVKPILVLAALYLYQPLVELLLVKPVSIINDIAENAAVTTLNVANMDELIEIAEAELTEVKNEEGEDVEDETITPSGSGRSSIYEFIQVSSFLEFLHLLIQIAALVVTGFLLLRQVLLKAIFYILGVLVLPLALIPGNFDIIKQWFFGFLSILLWVPILTIFQTIIALIAQAPLENGFSQPLFSVVLQIVMIAFILQVPKYANFLATGTNDTASVGSAFGLIKTSMYNSVHYPYRANQERKWVASAFKKKKDN